MRKKVSSGLMIKHKRPSSRKVVNIFVLATSFYVISVWPSAWLDAARDLTGTYCSGFQFKNTRAANVKGRLAGLRIAHYTNHVGAARDLEYVFNELHMAHSTFLLLHYEVTKDWAQQYFDKHIKQINQFDIVITSDTPPLSRIFLQNVDMVRPKIVVWICNRWDYRVWGDQEFYALLKANIERQDSKALFIPYTEYEKVDSRKRLKIDIDATSTITPHGLQHRSAVFKTKAAAIYGVSPTGQSMENNDKIFVTRYENDQTHVNTPAMLTRGGVPHISGGYAHPEELQAYAALITFPDAMSKFLTFETIQYQVPVVLPSLKWLRKLANGTYWLNGDNQGNQPLHEYWFMSEWYRFPECRIFVDDEESLIEVARELSTGTYEGLKFVRAAMEERGKQIRETVLKKWQVVLSAESSSLNADVYKRVAEQDKYVMLACLSKFEHQQARHHLLRKAFELMIESSAQPKVIIEVAVKHVFQKRNIERSRLSPAHRNHTSVGWGAGSFTRAAAECNQHIDGLRVIGLSIHEHPKAWTMIKNYSFISTHRLSLNDFIKHYDGPPFTLLYSDSGRQNDACFDVSLAKLLTKNRYKFFNVEAYIVIDGIADTKTLVGSPVRQLRRKSCVEQSLEHFVANGWRVIFSGSQSILKAPL